MRATKEPDGIAVKHVTGVGAALSALAFELVAMPILSSLIFVVLVIAEMWNGRRSKVMTAQEIHSIAT